MNNNFKELQISLEKNYSQKKAIKFQESLNKARSKGQEDRVVYANNIKKEFFTKALDAVNKVNWFDTSVKRKTALYKDIIHPLWSDKGHSELTIKHLVAMFITTAISSTMSKTVTLTSVANKVIKSLLIEVPNGNTKYFSKNDYFSGILVILLDAIENSSNFFITEDVMKGKWVQLTEEAQEYISELEGKLLGDISDYQLMVTEPRRPHNLIDNTSGYLQLASPAMRRPVRFKEINNAPFNWKQDVKSVVETSNRYSLTPIHKDIISINSDNTPEVFEALWKLNETPISIDKDMFEAIQVMKDTGYSDLFKDNYNDTVVDNIRDFLQFDNLFTPYHFDQRGRVYSYATQTACVQSSEFNKCFVNLGNKELVNDKGWYNIFVTIGSYLGYDKKRCKARSELGRAWYTKHRDDILEGRYEALRGTEEPLMLCKTVLAAYRAEQGEPIGLIVPKDARSSAIQIVGVLLKSKQNCELTSVIDTDLDNEDLKDGYLFVADYVKSQMEAYSGDDEELQEFINKTLKDKRYYARKVAKRASMTSCQYGGTRMSGVQYMREGLKEVGVEEEPLRAWLDLFYNFMQDALPASKLYNKFAPKLAREALKKHGVVAYKNPITGFPVILREVVEDKVQVTTRTFDNKRVQLVLKEAYDITDIRGSVGAIAPGIIHSIDAALLVKIVNNTDADVLPVHDAFYTHPNHLEEVCEVYSEELSELSKIDFLNDIISQMELDMVAPVVNDMTEEDLALIKESKHSLT